MLGHLGVRFTQRPRGSAAFSPTLSHTLRVHPVQNSGVGAGSPAGLGRGGAGRTGQAGSHGLGQRVQTGLCGLASQGAGQEVLQVCGVGWGCLV